MITYSGIHIQKIGGECGTPTPIDIAVHAGRVTRFGGALWAPLLPHLVFVGLMAYRRSGRVENLLWGFLHDAHEIVTGEVPRPFKCDCMRKEQTAIDNRLPYLGKLRPAVDFDLIKQCDLDACDVEAVYLGLPNYRDTVYREKMAQQYGKTRPVVHDDPADVMLFSQIRNSMFFSDDIIHGETSAGVRAFATALTLAQLGDYEQFLFYVKSWGLCPALY